MSCADCGITVCWVFSTVTLICGDAYLLSLVGGGDCCGRPSLLISSVVGVRILMSVVV